MIDNACRMAVEAGIDAVRAIGMATASTAECFGLDHGVADQRERRGAVAPGRRADLLLLDDLTFAKPPHRVYAAGELVAEDGRFLGAVAPAPAHVEALEQALRGTVKLPALSDELFDYPFRPGEAVIDVVLAKPSPAARGPRRLRACGASCSSSATDAASPAQQAGADGDGPAGMGLVGRHIGRGWVRGFSIEGGAIASTVGHDSHNVCVVGDNPRGHADGCGGARPGWVRARPGRPGWWRGSICRSAAS